MTTVEQLMREIQQITKGQVTLTLGEDGHWTCRSFEQHLKVTERVIGQIEDTNPARLTMSSYMDLLTEERDKQTAYGTGRTAIRAVAALLDKIQTPT